MTTEAALLADEFYQAIQNMSRNSVRSKQVRIGISDLGFCPERTRRQLDGQTPNATDTLLAWLGTAIGDHAEQAWCAYDPTAIRQAEIKVLMEVVIEGKPYRITIPGHPDLILPERGILLDAKSDYLLADAERSGATRQQRFQRHLYGLGAWSHNLFHPGIERDEVQVGNVWIDRSGQDKRVHVELEPLSMDVVQEATDWLEDVVYHMLNKQPAHKQPPRDMCRAVCGFFSVCREVDTDVSGLLDDPQVLRAVDMYREGLELGREADRLKKAAKPLLDEVSGNVRLDEDVWQIRWTSVEPALRPETMVKGYKKLEVRRLSRGKAKT